MQKILLIDDNMELCTELAAVLRDEGYLVDNTSDSEVGAAMIRKEPYDMYILDYKMKGLNGIDLLKIIKSVNPLAVAFIISGKSSIEMLIKAEALDKFVAAIIKKPFKIEELLAKIKNAG